jgi:hypothetical protein
MRAPILLNLYDRETQEVKETLSAVFVPFDILKASLRLTKQLGSKPAEDLTEDDIDAIAALVKEIFPSNVTLDTLLKHADLSDMMNVLQNINGRGVQSMDPTFPLKAKKK